MICKIADLITEVPESGGMAPRLRDYRVETDQSADIVIREEDYRPNAWRSVPPSMYAYMESGAHFYASLLYHGGMQLHASAVAWEGRGYLFSGQCGVGKSTHTRLWQELLGEEAVVFNDDKPALRRLEEGWYAYGTPWCGKDGINANMKVPLAGICFLVQGPENRIRRMTEGEAIPLLITQTMNWFNKEDKMQLMLSCVERLAAEVPIYLFQNRPEKEAAMLSLKTMRES